VNCTKTVLKISEKRQRSNFVTSQGYTQALQVWN